MKRAITLMLSVSIGACSEPVDKAKNTNVEMTDAGTNDAQDVQIERPENAVGLTVMGAERKSLSANQPPQVIVDVEIYNGLSGGLLVQASALRLVVDESPTEVGANLSAQILENPCPAEPLILTPGGALRCQVAFEVEPSATPSKAVLVTTSEAPDQPSIRVDDDINDFEECEICGDTCLPYTLTACGACGVSCSAPSGLDRVCAGGSPERLRVFTPNTGVVTLMSAYSLTPACIEWLGIDQGETKTCAERCAEEGLACIEVLGYVQSSAPGEMTEFYGPMTRYTDGVLSDSDAGCDKGVRDAEFIAGVWCSCHSADVVER